MENFFNIFYELIVCELIYKIFSSLNNVTSYFILLLISPKCLLNLIRYLHLVFLIVLENKTILQI